jgi:G3E family GTPase
VPPFHRVVVETTGLADPAPIVYTLLSEPVVRHHYELETVVATIDAVHGLEHEESVKQAAIADTLVVTKGDLADPGPLVRRLRRLNPAAEIVKASFGDVEPDRLLGRAARDPRDIRVSEHGHEDIRAVSLFLDEQLDWTAFGIWLTMLLQARGQKLLRVKGLLNVGSEGPLLLNGVQHAVHPPQHMEAWPDEDRRSRLVFIGRDVDAKELERSLGVFNRLADRSEAGARAAPPAPHGDGRP